MTSPLRIVLVDSSGPLHKWFHGQSQPRVSVVDGKTMDVAAVYGYLEYCRKLTQEIDYDVLVHVLDPEGGSAQRLVMYPLYKANREATHPVLSAQKNLLYPILKAFGQNVIKINGVESDDIIGTLAKKYVNDGHDVLIISQDKDLLQLVEDGKVVLARYTDQGPGRPKTHEFYEESDVVTKLGVRADQVADWLALTGDAVDNIPGVHGVGDKKAAKLLEEYGTLSSIMTHADAIPGALGKSVREELPNLPLYRQLTGIFTDILVDPVYDTPTVDPERVKWARDIVKAPEFWPDDLTSDLRDPPAPPSAMKM